MIFNDYRLSTTVGVLSHLNIAVFMGLSCRPDLTSSSTGCAAHISRIATKGDTYLSTLNYLIKDQTMISKQGRIFLTFLLEKCNQG